MLRDLARNNKLYLPFLRVMKDVYKTEWIMEELRLNKYLNSVFTIANTLEEFEYVIYKFRKPKEHVSVDIDVLISRNDVEKAVKKLLKKGFKLVIIEPYTLTLKNGDVILDLYVHPSFAWTVYMNGDTLLNGYVEEIEIDGVQIKTLTKDAETVVVAAHAIFKEHLYLLSDYYTVKYWLSKESIRIAEEHNVTDALEISIHVNRCIEKGLYETPLRINKWMILKTYFKKMCSDSVFRTTSLNITKYMLRKDFGRKFMEHLFRISY